MKISTELCVTYIVKTWQQETCINNERDIIYANSSYRKGKVENRIEINKQEYYLLGKM